MQARKDKIPADAGIGLRSQHYVDLLQRKPGVAWLEAHPENYFGEGGAPLYYLEKLREHYPLSLHGVGLSLGSVDPLNMDHLKQLKSLIDRFDPGLFSEHLSWGSFEGSFMNDLLPMPYTEEALDHFCERVSQTQDFLGRRMLVENPSSYLSYTHSTIPEAEFLIAIAQRTGCGLLLDINNIYVSAENHDFDAIAYMNAIPSELVGEIHLAGHARNQVGDQEVLIDDHGSQVSTDVWALFDEFASKGVDVPVLIEWDSDVPELDVLLAEADKARQITERYRAHVA
ncbi:MAG TPA: hypothetical protein DD979_14755 [Gammaproteobacteria bacterium]|jgi:uncharacterized protein (UPF0276 family)|nr:hypothetical protein [Gammaproteobacteria bacterium]